MLAVLIQIAYYLTGLWFLRKRGYIVSTRKLGCKDLKSMVYKNHTAMGSE
jgi:hypothetical protein